MNCSAILRHLSNINCHSYYLPVTIHNLMFLDEKWRKSTAPLFIQVEQPISHLLATRGNCNMYRHWQRIIHFSPSLELPCFK